MKISQLPKHLRPREKLLSVGAQNTRDVELVAILLRTGRSGKNVLEISAEVLKKFPLEKILDVEAGELRKIKGLDQGKICTLLAAFELTKRALRSYETSLPIISSPDEASEYVHTIARLKKEHFVVMYLNARNQLIYQETISIGTLSASLVHPREVFAPALEVRAGAVILAHNHPSGNLEPSPEDIEITKRLKKAGELLGIAVLDHLIIGSRAHLSMKSLGWC